MIGDALKVALLANDVGTYHGYFYFPAGTWCNIFNLIEKCVTTNNGEIQKRSA